MENEDKEKEPAKFQLRIQETRDSQKIGSFHKEELPSIFPELGETPILAEHLNMKNKAMYSTFCLTENQASIASEDFHLPQPLWKYRDDATANDISYGPMSRYSHITQDFSSNGK